MSSENIAYQSEIMKQGLHLLDTEMGLIKENKYSKNKIAGLMPRVVGVVMSATLLTGLSTQGLNAAAVRNDIPYQYFKDFANNMGVFKPGAENIPIYNKSGELVGVLDKAPMPDFAAVDAMRGVATLFHPSYVGGVKHNGGETGGYPNVRFGGASDALYTIVDRNIYPTYDYHMPRLNKIVTEVAPAEITDVTKGEHSDEKTEALFFDNERFPVFYRIGNGSPQILYIDETKYGVDLNGNRSGDPRSYYYSHGGTLPTPFDIDWKGMQIKFRSPGAFSLAGPHENSPLGHIILGGDSGSPLFTYDTVDKKWIVVGYLSNSLSHSTGYQMHAGWVIPDYDWTMSEIKKDTAPEIQLKGQSVAVWERTDENGGATITQNQNSFSAQGKSSNSKEGVALNDGKNLIISNIDNARSIIELKSNIHQGAGSITFRSDAVVKSDNDSSWQGAGIIIEKDKTVDWRIDGVEGDTLHRIGEGTLVVNGTGVNKGELSAGDGTTILAQKADENGDVQAFGTLRIVSGRSKVILTDDKQVNPDNIMWGFRGGELDINGNDLVFNRIRALDIGAVLNNSSDETAVVTFNSDKKQYIYHGQIKGNIDVVNNAPSNEPNQAFVIDGNLDLENNQFTKTKGSLIFQGNAITHLGGTDRKATLLTQSDWDEREFKVKQLNLENANFTLGRNATLYGDIAASKSTVKIGSDTAFVDTNDGDKVIGMFNQDQSKVDHTVAKDIQKIETGLSVNGPRSSKYYGVMKLDDSKAIVQEYWMGGIQATNSNVELLKGQQDWNESSSLLDSNVQVKNSKLSVSAGMVGNGAFDVDSSEVNIENSTDSVVAFEAKNINLKNNSVLNVKSGTDTSFDISASGSNVFNFGDTAGGYQSHSGVINAATSVVNNYNNKWSITNNSVIGTLNVLDSIVKFDSADSTPTAFSTLSVNNLDANNTTFALRTEVVPLV